MTNDFALFKNPSKNLSRIRKSYCDILAVGTLSLALLLSCEKGRTPTQNENQGHKEVTKNSNSVYPHSGDWKKIHGETYLADSKTCTVCHGSLLDGGTSKVSCNQCHSSYPHKAFWAKPENHGLAFGKLLTAQHEKEEDVSKNECFLCHKSSAGPSVPTGSVKSGHNLNCNQCHVGVPHDAMMITRDGQSVHHMVFGSDRVLEAACLSCHKAIENGARKYMPTLTNCTTCHWQAGVKPRVKWMSDDESKKVQEFLDNLRKSP